MSYRFNVGTQKLQEFRIFTLLIFIVSLGHFLHSVNLTMSNIPVFHILLLGLQLILVIFAFTQHKAMITGYRIHIFTVLHCAILLINAAIAVLHDHGEKDYDRFERMPWEHTTDIHTGEYFFAELRHPGDRDRIPQYPKLPDLRTRVLPPPSRLSSSSVGFSLHSKCSPA